MKYLRVREKVKDSEPKHWCLLFSLILVKSTITGVIKYIFTCLLTHSNSGFYPDFACGVLGIVLEQPQSWKPALAGLALLEPELILALFH